jgi:hypothetical protein
VCNEKAVCGDDRIDREQGEVCDPPGGVDGCEGSGICSSDCKSCISTNPCSSHNGNETVCRSTQCYSNDVPINCTYDQDTQRCDCPIIN